MAARMDDFAHALSANGSEPGDSQSRAVRTCLHQCNPSGRIGCGRQVGAILVCLKLPWVKEKRRGDLPASSSFTPGCHRLRGSNTLLYEYDAKASSLHLCAHFLPTRPCVPPASEDHKYLGPSSLESHNLKPKLNFPPTYLSAESSSHSFLHSAYRNNDFQCYGSHCHPLHKNTPMPWPLVTPPYTSLISSLTVLAPPTGPLPPIPKPK